MVKNGPTLIKNIKINKNLRKCIMTMKLTPSYLLSLKSWAGRSHGPVILFLVVEVTTHTAGLAVLADWHVDFHNVHTVPLELKSGDQVDFLKFNSIQQFISHSYYSDIN